MAPFISRRFTQIAPQMAQIFTWVDVSKHLNTLYQKNLRDLRGDLRKSAGNKQVAYALQQTTFTIL